MLHRKSSWLFTPQADLIVTSTQVTFCFYCCKLISLFMCFLLEKCVSVMCSQWTIEKMMKHKSRCHHPPPYETVWEKPTTGSHSVQIRKELGLGRADSCPRLGKNRPSQHPVDTCCAKRTKSIARTFAISSQEITAFFKLFGK